ncbi:S8 family serine peptidase [Kribbella sp. NPDC020789]
MNRPLVRRPAILAAAILATVAVSQLPASAADSGSQPNPSAGLDRIDQRDRPLDKTYTWTAAGAGVRIYLVSTGVNVTHTDVGGRATQEADLVGGTMTPSCAVVGTGVAGLAAGTKYGVAKQARVVSVRAFGCSGQPTAAQAIAGINWVTGNAVKPAVAVLPDAIPADAAVDAAIQQSTAAGITWVVAAGNHGTDFGFDACQVSPARVTEAITATELDLPYGTVGHEQLVAGANRGPCVDIAAPNGITALGGGSDENPWGIRGGHVGTTAGAVAKLVGQSPTAAPATIQQQLKDAATTGKLTDDHLGTPDRVLYSR